MRLKDSFFSILETTEMPDSAGGVVYKIKLNAGHPIYQAHFPNKPITPGVCIIQMAIELLGEHVGKEMVLKEIKNVKFIFVISPEENEELNYVFNRISNEGDKWKAQLTVDHGDSMFAKISITCETTTKTA